MAKLKWHEVGERFYHTGVEQVALYVVNDQGEYGEGVAWNGVTSISESPSGGDPQDLYADDDKYIVLRGKEQFGGTIEAYQSPEEFDQCDGMATVAKGVTIAQQTRKSFGLAYITKLGNDVEFEDYGEILHLVYGCTASPSSRQFQTINESPEAMTLSWEFTTIPVSVANHKSTSIVRINLKELTEGARQKVIDTVYGSSSAEASLPTPDELITLVKGMQ